jgi:hypothetical protein
MVVFTHDPGRSTAPGVWIIALLCPVGASHCSWIGTVHDSNCKVMEVMGGISLSNVSLCLGRKQRYSISGHPAVPRGEMVVYLGKGVSPVPDR